MKITTAERLVKVRRAIDRIRTATPMASVGMQRVVLTHGCFDVIHPGHLRHLRWAKEQGDVLVVSITSDRFVNKGAGRPWIPELQRADLIGELKLVDHVLITDAPEPSELIRMIRPDIYVKGWEYKNRDLPELDALIDANARLMFSPNDVLYHSTELGPPRG